ncbi:MAG: alkaline phosphatase family protein [Kiloniellales bacterium]
MKSPVIAIGLDSAEADLIERWTADGKLPTLARLKAGGTYGRTEGNEIGFSEVAWPSFYTGCWPEKTGYWQHIKFNPKTYGMTRGSYNYGQVPPFYALGNDFKVATFDLPQATLSDDVNGIQVLAWGAHSPYTKRISKPADVLPKLLEKYGSHPAFDRDHARPWRKRSVHKLQERMRTGVELRRKICKDIMQRDNWDFFLTVFSETHSAPHYTWHVSNETGHELHDEFKGMFGGADPVLEIYQLVDRALADVLAAAPKDARVVIFSQEGMENNGLDLPNMAFLPEIMYRMNFPGQIGLMGSEGGANTEPPPRVLRPLDLGWVRSIYSTKADSNPLRRFVRKNLLMEAGYKLEKHIFGEAPGPGYPYSFNPYFSPSMWFSNFWPKMRAFALPALGDGFIRINLQGRERDGIVPLEQYEAVCNEIEDQLKQFRDPRTQRPAVKKVIRTRSGSAILEDGGPQGDLVVKWNCDHFIDVIDSPTLGRIGPVTCRRPGGHNTHGFFIANGPDIPVGRQATDARWVDVAPMILELLGAPIPDYMDGRSPIAMARNAA